MRMCNLQLRLYQQARTDYQSSTGNRSEIDVAAKAIRWGISEMDLLLTTDGTECPGCDAPGQFCQGTETAIFVPDSINVDDLVGAIEQVMGPSNAFGKVNHAAFYLDPAQISNFTPAGVIQLLAATGNALTGLGHRVDLNAGIAAANQVLGN